MKLIILFFGFLFGAILQYANLNKFNVISGLATGKNFTVIKALSLAIGLGAILINIEITLGLASYHIKPFLIGGVVIGGLIFGIGMAILGYCPGTMAISLGQGSIDAFWGILGGLLGGVFYTLILPFINPILGTNLGQVSINSLVNNKVLFFILLFVIGFLLIGISFLFNKIDNSKNRKWILSGIALAVLNAITIAAFTTDRPIGASTAYPYLGDFVTGITGNDYFYKIKIPGNWELIFLLGAFIAGLTISLVKKQFKFKLLHINWIAYKGNSKLHRVIWSLGGGFILIIGARMAGGCTSGHILSGGMQLALSSFTFAVFVFTGLLITGKIFYK